MVISGRSHRFLGINQCCGESTGCRHGGNRTQDLLNRSPSVLKVITGTVILHLKLVSQHVCRPSVQFPTVSQSAFTYTA